MITIRQSDTAEWNKELKETNRSEAESMTNRAWLDKVGATDGLILLGGAAVPHFRIRVAQCHARADLKPSCWSLAGILIDNQKFLSVPLELCGDASEIAQLNGVAECSMADYDDQKRFPNIAVIRFTNDAEQILDNAGKVKAQRSIIDLPTLMLPWLSYIWIAGKAANPLAEGLGLPSAAFVQTVYGIAGIELTPGLASGSSCPEAIWQAAKYWSNFYRDAAATAHETNAAPQVPSGNYAIRQPAAAADWPPEG